MDADVVCCGVALRVGESEETPPPESEEKDREAVGGERESKSVMMVGSPMPAARGGTQVGGLAASTQSEAIL